MFWEGIGRARRGFCACLERLLRVVLSMLGASFESVLECFEKALDRLGEGFEHSRSVF